MTKLWLDDERPSPLGWAHARTARQAIDILDTCTVTEVSLDHDLGDGQGSGYEVACWIEKAAKFGQIPRLRWSVHSANPVGKARMEQALRHADTFWEEGERGQSVP